MTRQSVFNLVCRPGQPLRIVQWLVQCAAHSIVLVAACSACWSQTPRIHVGRLRVELERIADVNGTVMSLPIHMGAPDDGTGRLVFAEKDKARLRILSGSTFSTLLDLSSEVVNTSERGLLGVAFHPGFGDSLSPGYRKLYTFHSVPIDAGAIVDFRRVLAL